MREDLSDEKRYRIAQMTVGPPISHEGLVLPRHHVGWRPVEFARLLVKGRSLVVDVARRQKSSGCDWLHGSAHQNAIHNDIVADPEGSHGELVFGGNILEKSVGLISEFDSFAGLQIHQRGQNVVAGIELKHLSMHLSFEASLPVTCHKRAAVLPFRPPILKQSVQRPPRMSLNPPSVAKTFARYRQARHLEILVCAERRNSSRLRALARTRPPPGRLASRNQS